MIRALFYSAKHALMYRQPRQGSPRALARAMRNVQRSDGVRECQTVITDLMLCGAGLRVVTDDNDRVPRFTYLTPLQRQLIALVGPFGFKVGVL